MIRRPIDPETLSSYRYGAEIGVMKSATPNVVLQMLDEIERLRAILDSMVAACTARDFNAQQRIIGDWESQKRDEVVGRKSDLSGELRGKCQWCEPCESCKTMLVRAADEIETLMIDVDCQRYEIARLREEIHCSRPPTSEIERGA